MYLAGVTQSLALSVDHNTTMAISTIYHQDPYYWPFCRSQYQGVKTQFHSKCDWGMSYRMYKNRFVCA